MQAQVLYGLTATCTTNPQLPLTLLTTTNNPRGNPKLGQFATEFFLAKNNGPSRKRRAKAFKPVTGYISSGGRI